MNTHTIDSNPMKFAIIGCGKVGTHLSVFLEKKGFLPAAFYSRTRASANTVQKMVGNGQVMDTALDAVKAAEIVFLTTSDDNIGSVCREIAENGGFGTNHFVFHLSGALSSNELTWASEKGASIASIHPLQSFPPYQPGQESLFEGSYMSMEGDENAVNVGKQIANALGCHCFVMPTSAKILYHAAAVTASNYLVTLISGALEMMAKTGLDSDEAYNVLEPLITGSLNNIKRHGTHAALTGPISRGDASIVQRHLEDMEKNLPEQMNLYRAMGTYTLALADEQGKLKPRDRQALADLLKIP